MESFRSSFEHRNATAVGGAGEAGVGTKPELVRSRRGGLLEVPAGGGWFGKGAWGINNTAERKKMVAGPTAAPGKLLVNVKMEGSLGTVQVVMMSENTVHDLKKAVVEIYVKEKRRPFLECCDPRGFVLYYSPFSLEGLNAGEKLKNLVSRNFFMRQKPDDMDFNTDFNHAVAKPPFSFVELLHFVL